MSADTPNSVPLEFDSIKDAAINAPGSTIDFMVAVADLGLHHMLKDCHLYIHPSFGISLERKMVDPDYVAIPLPGGTSVGHLFATLLACPLPALILYCMRNGESDEDEGVKWREIYLATGQSFINALANFDSRGLQAVIANSIGEARRIVADIAGVVNSDATGAVE